MLDSELLKSILMIALASSIITTAVIQKVKEGLNQKKYLLLTSFVVSMVIGTLFSLTFSTANIIESLWVGLICFIGAGTIYQMFEDKIFKSYTSMKETVTIPAENNIRGEENE